MARIPRAENLTGDAQQTRGVVSVPVIEESAAVARETARAGKALQDFGIRIQQADTDRKGVEASRKTREELDREFRKIADAGDIKPEDIESKYTEASNAVIARNGEAVPQGGRSLWTQRAKEWQSDGLLRARSLTRERQLENARAGLISENAAIEKMAGDLTIQDTTFAEAMSSQRNFIDRQVRDGFIGKDDAAKLYSDLDSYDRKDTFSRKKSRIDGLVRSGQTADAVALIEESGTYEERDSLYRVMEAVENERYQKSERMRIEQDRALKETQVQSAKTMDELMFAGSLSPAWLRENRDRLSEGDYQRGYARLDEVQKGDFDSNAKIYAELTYRSASGEDVSGEVWQAMTEGHLNKTDAGTLLARSGNNVEQPSWSKRGLEFINNSLKPSDLNDDPARNLRFAQAVEEWRDYVGRQTAPPDRAAAQKELDAIVSSYSLVPPSAVAEIALPASRVLGRRPASEADLEAWKAQINAGSASMRDEDLKREVDLYKRWEAYMKTKAPKPKAPN